MTTRGQRIQKLRSDNSLSQEAFASVLGVSRQSVSKWESDKAFPDIDKLELICKHFGISSDWLIMGEEILEEAPPEKEERKKEITISKKLFASILALLSLSVFSAVGILLYLIFMA